MSETKIIIALSNPKSPTNVGAVMRAAGCFCADSVLYTGKRYDRAIKFNTDTQKISATVPLTGVSNFFDHKEEGVKVVCVDLVEGALPLPLFTHPKKALYIFGPEDGTIAQSVVDQADAVVYIPTIGCMNLAATVNVVLYDRLAKSTAHATDNLLIRQSRDTNNNVKVPQYTRK